jgi:hypothetical protein
MAAAKAIATAFKSTPCAHPFGQPTCIAKNRARLAITPTTAAVTPVSAVVNANFPCVLSINGAPARIKIKEGKKVNQVTTRAAMTPDSTA